TVVLGDSHAMNLYNIFAKSGVFPFLVGISQGGCRPHDNKAGCHYDGFDAFAAMHKGLFSRIVFHQSGSYFIKDGQGHVDSQKAFLGSFDSFATDDVLKVISYLEKLKTLSGTSVLWIGPFVEYRYNPQEVLENPGAVRIRPESVVLFNALEKQIKALVEEQGFKEYRSFDTIFTVPAAAMIGECFVYKDSNHFSLCGEDFVASRSVEALTQIRDQIGK
ncbi:MAG: hypothetical protein KDJ15_04770, partial [Alphaproteobacteria bacterium]|nr:hypothetical protein [Alphaproteobacteria bacterium]